MRNTPPPTADKLALGARLALSSLALILLAACSRRQPDPVIRLTWWVPYAEESAEYPTFQTLAETYTERAGTVINLVSVPWDDLAPRGTASRLSLALGASPGSQGPDVWGPVPSTWIGPYVTEGQVLALEAGQVQNSGQYAEIATLACRWAGQQYALPVLMDSLALIYNRAKMSRPPANWDELDQIAQELTDAEAGQWGLVLPLLSQYHAYPFMDGYGGYIFKCEVSEIPSTASSAASSAVSSTVSSVASSVVCDVSDIGLNNEGSVRGVEFLSRLYAGDARRTRLPESLADRASMHQDAVSLFAEGQAGMLIDGSWAIPQIRAAGIDYGVGAIPELPEGVRAPRALTTVQVLAANASTAHPAETVDLLNYLASAEAATALQGALGKAPVRRDVMRQPALREDRELEAWYDQAANGVLLPQAPELGYVWAPWARALDEAIPGLKPAQEALDQAVVEIRSYIEPE